MMPQERRWWQRLTLSLASTRPIAWLYDHLLYQLDRWLLQHTGGRHSLARWTAGLRLYTLTTTGARSGRERSVPLVGIPHDEGIILVASNWGGASHPAWYYNLRAHPQVTLSREGETRSYRARITGGAEREALWQKAVAYYPGYAAYRRRTSREIPVVYLAPAEA